MVELDTEAKVMGRLKFLMPPPYFEVSEADRTPEREDGLPFDPDP